MCKYRRALLRACMVAGVSSLSLGNETALAQTSTSDGASAVNEQGLADIVVTARRREENLQKVPISITVVSPDELRENNINDMVSLQYQAPSLTLFTFAEDVTISLRGQGGFDPGSSPAVVGYFNEIPIPSTSGSNAGAFKAGGFYDLDSVQVLNGPQGTLFGRNTTGGAVLFQTRRPTNKLEGYVEAAFGNYRDRELEFALNLPLIDDKLLVRFAGRRQVRDGYTRALSTPGHPNGLDLDDSDNWGGRVSVTLKPVQGVRNDTIVEFYRSSTNNASSLLRYVAPDGFAAFLYTGLDDLVAQQEALGPRRQLSIGVDPFNKTSRWSLANLTSIELSDNVTLRNIFGYYKLRTSNVFDGDGTTLPIFDYPSAYPVPTQREQLTEEVQLQGEAFDKRLTWVAGAFLLHEPKPRPDRFLYEVFGGTPYGAVSIAQEVVADNSKALYAQATYDLAGVIDGLKVTAGYRHTWDRRFTMRLPEQAICKQQAHDPLCFAKFKSPTWTLALDYQAASDLMFYGTVRRGFRSGGINSGAFGDLPRTFPPEYVIDQEVGFKSRWSLGGMAGRTNLAVYHQTYKNIHFSTTYVAPDGSAPIITKSGASADIWGAELEGAIYPAKGLELGGSFSWIDLSFTDFVSGLSPDDIAEIRGRKRDQRPRFKYNLHARYRHALGGNAGELAFAANWAWQSRSGTINPPNVPADPLKIRAPYGWLNLNASWDNVGGAPVDVTLFMTNVTNKAVGYGQMTVADSIGVSTLHYLEPRMYGLRVRYRFGD